MKNLSIILAFALVALISCTKSKEVHPELGDGNEEFITVAATTAHVEYTRADIAELRKVVFHYGLSGAQQFTIAEMAKKEDFFDLTLNDLVNDTLYYYYYEVFPGSGDASTTEQKTFHTLAVDSPVPPTPPGVELPTVVTAEVSDITANSAVCGGEVTFDGGAEVSERGICWSTNANPTLNDNHVTAGTGTGSFSATMNGLEANTTYHVRAYATNEKGTAYGLDKEFTTIGGGSSGAPEGAIDGLFSVSPTQKVYFSQGNLQYQASTNTWRFAENQWDFVGDATNGSIYENGVKCNNELISSTYNGWIDLFGWGTSGFDHGAICYQPWSIEEPYEEMYYAYGNAAYNLYDQTGQADWGYNTISNGGNTTNIWRTLNYEEMEYLFIRPNTSSGIRYAKAIVNGVNGLILLPDNWNPSVFLLNSTNDVNSTFDSNVVSLSEWTSVLQTKGAVFLPVTGNRFGISLSDMCTAGCYWASSCRDYVHGDCLDFGGSNSYNGIHPFGRAGRYRGSSVRLVQDANP